MIRKSAYTILLAMACITAFAATASATTVGGEVFGAFSTHSMKDWNDRVVAPNNASGGNMQDFNSGYGGGLGLRLWPNSKWMLAATWEPLFVSSEDKVSGDKANLKANAYEATAGYFFPTHTPAKFGLGAGLGIYSLGGEITSPTSSTLNLEGSTVGFHVMGMTEWTVKPGFSLTGNIGYRIADIKDTKVNNTSASPELSTDYSGLMLRAGVAFYLPGLSK
jgi:hypothetical protein